MTTAIDFEVFRKGYFERNDSGLKGKSSYLLLETRAAFESLFGIARTMGEPPPWVEPVAFERSLAVVAIRRSNAIWTFEVDEVVRVEDEVRVAYRADEGTRGTASYACPLIILIPRGDYRKIRVLENGKRVATLEPAR